ncbi:MAG: hypothetical protein U0992_00540 [Planctomycetaceae bacterium]
MRALETHLDFGAEEARFADDREQVSQSMAGSPCRSKAAAVWNSPAM